MFRSHREDHNYEWNQMCGLKNDDSVGLHLGHRASRKEFKHYSLWLHGRQHTLVREPRYDSMNICPVSISDSVIEQRIQNWTAIESLQKCSGSSGLNVDGRSSPSLLESPPGWTTPQASALSVTATGSHHCFLGGGTGWEELEGSSSSMGVSTSGTWRWGGKFSSRYTDIRKYSYMRGQLSGLCLPKCCFGGCCQARVMGVRAFSRLFGLCEFLAFSLWFPHTLCRKISLLLSFLLHPLLDSIDAIIVGHIGICQKIVMPNLWQLDRMRFSRHKGEIVTHNERSKHSCHQHPLIGGQWASSWLTNCCGKCSKMRRNLKLCMVINI